MYWKYAIVNTRISEWLGIHIFTWLSSLGSKGFSTQKHLMKVSWIIQLYFPLRGRQRAICCNKELGVDKGDRF